MALPSEEGLEEAKVARDEQADEDFFKQIDQIATSTAQSQGEKPLVIVDASNVAMRHGKNSFFSVKGIQLACEYWQKNGHQILCFLPDYLFSYEQVNLKKKLNQLNIKDYKASQMPDNVGLLNTLAAKGYIIKTPPQDYDDSYSI
jgi:Zc3h12a-like Ribonuclease NYN domain